jgi:acyl carrier protein
MAPGSFRAAPSGASVTTPAQPGHFLRDKQQIIESIYRAIDEFNALVSPPAQLDKSPSTVLFGEHGRLDSLGLVSLILDVEGQIEADFETPVSLTSDRAMSQKTSPFRSVDTLADYIAELLREQPLG